MTIQNSILMTADEFAALDYAGRAELVRGRVVYLTKPKPKHGRIAMRIGTAISIFVRPRNLGEVYAAETGFIAGRDPDSVRAPDVAFVRAEVAEKQDEDEWYPHSPDLAVEVLSPTERPETTKAKVRMWLEGGGRSVWVIDPKKKIAIVHRIDASSARFSAGDSLCDESILPGFLMPLNDIFD